MSAGDGPHKLASPRERDLHQDLCALVRAVVEGYAARRLAAERSALGFDLKKTVVKGELAERLGIGLRQLDGYASAVPITLAKAVLLSEATGDDRLLQAFALRLGAVAVAVPRPDSGCDLALANAELAANMREFVEFQESALRLSAAGKLDAESYRAIRKEGLESIVQAVRLILLAEQAATGAVREPARLASVLRRDTAQLAERSAIRP